MNGAHVLVTVHDHENSRQLHGCSRFRTCRAGGCTTKDQALRLRERDVAPVRQRRDAQAAAVANVLVVVLDLCVADVDLRSSTSVDGFGCCRSVQASASHEPDLALARLVVLRVAQLRLPLEGSHVVNALDHETLHHIARMHINGAQRNQLFAIIGAQLASDQLDQLAQLGDLALMLDLHVDTYAASGPRLYKVRKELHSVQAMLAWAECGAP